MGAALGAGSGLLVGTLAGGACGAVGGGAAGYSTYSKRAEISQCAGCVSDKATGAARALHEHSSAALSHATKRAQEAKAQAYASAGYVAERSSAATARLVGRSGTGGTH